MALLGATGFGVVGMGAVLALATSVIRPAEVQQAQEVQERRWQGQQRARPTAPVPLEVRAPPPTGPHGEVYGYRVGTELLEAFAWREADNDSIRYVADSFDALIAILADPYDSRLDWSYDASLEAIRRAFERAGYVADRMWLPGRDETVMVEDTTRALPGGGRRGAARDAEPGDTSPKQVVPRRELHPGVILFRSHENGRTQLRLLYVVGETPTRGIHKAALQTALLEREYLLGQMRPPPEPAADGSSCIAVDTVRIIGPTFSGSAVSVSYVLDGWLDARVGVDVELISGSATSYPREGTRHGGRTRFTATVNPDSHLNELLRREVLDPLNLVGPQVVLLRESSTVYGSTVYAQRASGREAPVDTIRGSAFLQIPFPLHIASVRAAYEQGAVDPLQADLLLAGRAASPIPLSLRDGGVQRDAPAITSQLTPAALDLSLDEIARTLQRHDVRAVGVLATDVRDKLFLGDFVRRRLGDIQLFTFETSNLFLRSEYNSALRGMLVLSSYPLVLENQWWPHWGRPPLEERIHFVSDGVQGVHNAALIQLGRFDLALEYGMPYDSTGTHMAPPVWLTVVGSRSFLPIRVFEGDETGYVARDVTHGLGRPGKQPHRASLLGVAGIVLLMSVVVGVSGGTILFGAWRLWRPRVPAEPRAVKPPGGAESGAPAESQTAEAAEPNAAGVQAARGGGDGKSELAAIEAPAAVAAGPPGDGEASAAGVAEPLPGERGSGELGRSTDGSKRVWMANLQFGPRPKPPTPKHWYRVQHASLRIHLWLYSVLLLIAVGILAAPPAAVLLADHGQAGHGTDGLEEWVIGFAAAGAVLVWVIAVAVAMTRGLHALVGSAAEGWSFARGLRYLSGSQGVLWIVELLGRIVAIAVGLTCGVLAALFLLDIHQLASEDPRTFALFAHRALQLESGVSPLLPVMLTGAGFTAWCTWHLQRIRLLLHTPVLEKLCLEAPARVPCAEPPSGPGEWQLTHMLVPHVAAIRDGLFRVVPHGMGVALLVLLAVPGIWLLARFGQSIEALVFTPLAWEATSFDLLLRLSVLATLFATSWALFRLIFTWRALHRCLDAVAETPLIGAFDRMPARIARMTRVSLVGDAPHERVAQAPDAAVATTSVRYWHFLQETFKARETEIRAALASDPELIRSVERLSKGPPTKTKRPPEQQLAELHQALADLWTREPTADALDAGFREPGAGPRSPVTMGGTAGGGWTGPTGLWLRVAEDLAAIKFADYLQWVLRHIRRLAVFLLLSLLITTLLLSSYSFQPQALAKLMFLFVLLATVGALVYVMVQVNRDEVVSRIKHTAPGQVTWNTSFVLNLALFAVLPLLALVSSEFAGLRSFLFAWLEPLLRQVTSL